MDRNGVGSYDWCQYIAVDATVSLTFVEVDLLGRLREYVHRRDLEGGHYPPLGRPFRENRDR